MSRAPYIPYCGCLWVGLVGEGQAEQCGCEEGGSFWQQLPWAGEPCTYQTAIGAAAPCPTWRPASPGEPWHSAGGLRLTGQPGAAAQRLRTSSCAWHRLCLAPGCEGDVLWDQTQPLSMRNPGSRCCTHSALVASLSHKIMANVYCSMLALPSHSFSSLWCSHKAEPVIV